jgi:hypothetical protein
MSTALWWLVYVPRYFLCLVVNIMHVSTYLFFQAAASATLLFTSLFH